MRPVWILNSMLAMQKGSTMQAMEKNRQTEKCNEQGFYLGLFRRRRAQNRSQSIQMNAPLVTCMYLMNSLTLAIKRYEDRTTQWGDSEGCRSKGTSWEAKWQYGNSKYILNRTEWVWVKTGILHIAQKWPTETAWLRRKKAKIKAIRWITVKGKYQDVLWGEYLFSAVVIRNEWLVPGSRVLNIAREQYKEMFPWNNCFRTISSKK